MSVYTVSGMMNVYAQNQATVGRYLAGTASASEMANFTAMTGIGLALFLLIVVLTIGIWVYAIYLLYTNWKIIPTWAQILGVIGVLPIPVPIGPFATILIVLLSRRV